MIVTSPRERSATTLTAHTFVIVVMVTAVKMERAVRVSLPTLSLNVHKNLKWFDPFLR